LQPALDFSDDHLDRDRVVATAGHDHIRVPLAGFDEFQMHRLHSCQLLLDDLVEWPSAVVCVTFDPPNKTDVGVGVDEDFHVT
jgi:hypothetical protein